MTQDPKTKDYMMVLKYCEHGDLRKISKIGPVEIKILMNSYNVHNLMLYPGHIVSNGYLLKNFKMLLILPEEVLVKFIQLIGLKDLFGITILKIKNWRDTKIMKLH